MKVIGLITGILFILLTIISVAINIIVDVSETMTYMITLGGQVMPGVLLTLAWCFSYYVFC